jgi:hypothetical protein
MSEECSAVDDVEAPIVSVKPQYYVTESGLPVGPKPDVQYPLTVLYCGNCGLPTEVKTHLSEIHIIVSLTISNLISSIVNFMQNMKSASCGLRKTCLLSLPSKQE